MGYKQLATKTVMLAVAALIGAGAPLAQGNDAILDLLVKKGVINQREANNIREQADADMAKQIEVTSKVKVAPFLQSMEWAGDMRLRGEYFNFGDGVTNGTRDNDRLRFRYRLRFGFIAKLQDWATVGVRLASGTESVSSNQTLGGYENRKSIGIDQAYIAVTPPFADWMTLTGGKFDSKAIWQPAFGSPMVTDNDLAWEGAHERVAYIFGEQKQYTVYGSFGQFVLNENAAANDVYWLEFQLGAEAKLGPVKTTLAGGTYYTQNLGGVSRTTAQAGSANQGNSVSAAGNYLDDFRVFYGRGETAWTVNEKTFLGTPNLITFSGEYLRNVNDGYQKAGFGTQGYTGQIAYGSTKKQGQWQVGYQYKRLEANATMDTFTDSDWGSTGGTDRKGHVFMATYAIRDWWTLGMKTFVTEKISRSTGSLGSSNSSADILRVQVDTVVKF